MKRLYVVALALVLAACGGDPPPAAPAGPSPTPSSTAVAAPVMPELAKEDSKEGAVAFVKYYVDVLNYAQATGSVGELKTLEDGACQSCRKVRKSIVDLYRSGGRITGGQFALSIDIVAPRPDLGDRWSLFGRIRFARSTVIRSGQIPESLKGGRAPVTFDVRFQDGKPTLMKWTREA